MSDSAIAHAVFGLMFETSTEALFIVDATSGRIVSANVRVADLLALDVGQVIGLTFDQIALEARDVSFDGRYEEVALRRGDDYPAFVTLTVAHIQVEGHGDYIAFTARDTTERRMLERELVAKHSALFAAHHDLEVAYTKLRDAQLELENRNREIAMLAWRAAVGELVAGIAHHLNNPLGALLSTTRHLGDRISKLPEEQRADLERLLVRITKVAVRIESNVNAIVKASRSATGATVQPLPPELSTVFETLSNRLDDIPTKDPS
ncbi:MAG TPA: histidine kinase dimerization/phospho-acceptor domain-containing protein [Kofleriaceae bacterium]